MKRILLTITGALCISLPLAAQTVTSEKSGKAGVEISSQIEQKPTISMEEIMQTPAWIESFTYSFTPASDTEPKIENMLQDFFRELQPIIGMPNNAGFPQAYSMLKSEISSDPEKCSAVLNMTLGAIAQSLYADALEKKNTAEANRYLDEAISNYEIAIKKFPNYQRVYSSLGRIYMNSTKEGSKAKAIPYLEKAIQLGANDAAVFMMLGYCNFLENNLYSAESAFKNAIARDSKNKEVYELLAQILMRQGRYQEAKAMFQELLRDDPNKDKLWAAMVNAYLDEEDLKNCTITLEILRHMKKANAQMLYLLGNIYLTDGIYDMATEVYLQAIKEHPTENIDDAVEASLKLSSYGAFEQATAVLAQIDKYYKGKISKKQELRVLTLRSDINISLGRGDEAAKVLKQILERDPNNGNALLSLATYYSEEIVVEEQGKDVSRPRDSEMAEMLLERAQDINDPSISAQAFRKHAALLVNKHDVDSLRSAVKLLKRSQEINPSDSVESYIQVIENAINAKTVR